MNPAKTSPNVADSIVPVVPGSVNLFWDNICIIRPLTAIDQPAKTKAIVRGILLINNKLICALLLPSSNDSHENEIAPNEMLNKHNIINAIMIIK